MQDYMQKSAKMKRVKNHEPIDGRHPARRIGSRPTRPVCRPSTALDFRVRLHINCAGFLLVVNR
ncbi:hypothetical protein D7S86_14540 [Pararobbsia silviterrae]|uniref:Uncharacterized protein n=1 Tax=Pararobbsia silviterrae TaxID=1792498 RepID=A0A494XY31_9BURK|nr:hypothetical protein D7S86_14540 [Pararobbsia silviterrae]